MYRAKARTVKVMRKIIAPSIALLLTSLVMATPAQAYESMEEAGQAVSTLEEEISKARAKKVKHEGLAQEARARVSRFSTAEQSAKSSLAAARANAAGARAGAGTESGNLEGLQIVVVTSTTAVAEANTAYESANTAYTAALKDSENKSRAAMVAGSDLDYAQSAYDSKASALSQAESEYTRARSNLTSSDYSQSAYTVAQRALSNAQAVEIKSARLLRTAKTSYSQVSEPAIAAEQSLVDAERVLNEAQRSLATAEQELSAAESAVADVEIGAQAGNREVAAAEAELKSLEDAAEGARNALSAATEDVNKSAKLAQEANDRIGVLSGELATATVTYQQLATAEKSASDLKAAQDSADAAQKAADEAAGDSNIEFELNLPENEVVSAAEYDEGGSNSLPLLLAALVAIGLAGGMVYRSKVAKGQENS